MEHGRKPAERIVLETWADQVKAGRDALGLSQVQAAARCGITQSTLSKIEAGDYRLHPAMVLKLCVGLDLNPSLSFAWPRAIVEIARTRSTAEAAA